MKVPVLCLGAAVLALIGSDSLAAQTPETATWGGTAVKINPFWLTTTNLRTGKEERALSMLILQVRDKAGQERRVSVSADTSKVQATTSTGAPFALGDLRSGAAITLTALRHPKKEGEPGLEYWEASKITIRTNGPPPKVP